MTGTTVLNLVKWNKHKYVPYQIGNGWDMSNSQKVAIFCYIAAATHCLSIRPFFFDTTVRPRPNFERMWIDRRMV